MPKSDPKSKTNAKKGKATSGVTSGVARRIVQALPGVADGTHYGYPSFMVGKQFLARLRDDDTVLVVHLRSFPDRDFLMSKEPETFFTTDHYRNYPTVLVRLEKTDEALLRTVLSDAHARVASVRGSKRR